MIAGRKQKHHPVIALVDEVLRLNSRLRTVFEGITESTGISSMQLAVLTAVVESRNPPTVPQIGRSLGHARQVIQRAANVLVDEGLIETRENPNHKRAPLLVVTEAGRQLKRVADVNAIDAAEGLLAVIDGKTCESLAEELHDLRTKIESHTRSRSR